MANSINTNVGALVALQNLNATNKDLGTVQNRINTGQKIATAKDNAAYWRATRKLRLKLFGKIVKSRCLTAPALRKWIMRSGVAHIPQLKD